MGCASSSDSHPRLSGSKKDGSDGSQFPPSNSLSIRLSNAFGEVCVHRAFASVSTSLRCNDSTDLSSTATVTLSSTPKYTCSFSTSRDIHCPSDSVDFRDSNCSRFMTDRDSSDRVDLLLAEGAPPRPNPLAAPVLLSTEQSFDTSVKQVSKPCLSRGKERQSIQNDLPGGLLMTHSPVADFYLNSRSISRRRAASSGFELLSGGALLAVGSAVQDHNSCREGDIGLKSFTSETTATVDGSNPESFTIVQSSTPPQQNESLPSHLTEDNLTCLMQQFREIGKDAKQPSFSALPRMQPKTMQDVTAIIETLQDTNLVLILKTQREQLLKYVEQTQYLPNGQRQIHRAFEVIQALGIVLRWLDNVALPFPDAFVMQRTQKPLEQQFQSRTAPKSREMLIESFNVEEKCTKLQNVHTCSLADGLTLGQALDLASPAVEQDSPPVSPPAMPLPFWPRRFTEYSSYPRAARLHPR